jgi:hypothetical protein
MEVTIPLGFYPSLALAVQPISFLAIFLGVTAGNYPYLAASQADVLPLHYSHHIKKQTFAIRINCFSHTQVITPAVIKATTGFTVSSLF